MRQALVVGNWKMNGTVDSIDMLLGDLLVALPGDLRTEVAVCPPFPYLPVVAGLLSDSAIAWGAQNLSDQREGAYTGEVSARMLADLYCRYVIVGHSERRSLYGESDALVAAKLAAAQREGLTPILCVGETLAEREGGQTLAVIERQLLAVIDTLGIAVLKHAVLAYEPVWAIGTGKTASPQQAQEVHAFIRQLLAQHDAAVASRVQILYGGSVNADNAAELFAQADIDGGLVGGASLDAKAFSAVCVAAG